MRSFLEFLLIVIAIVSVCYYSFQAVNNARDTGDTVGTKTILLNIILTIVNWFFAVKAPGSVLGIVIAFMTCFCLAGYFFFGLSSTKYIVRDWAKAIFIMGVIPFCYGSLKALTSEAGLAGFAAHPYETIIRLIIIICPLVLFLCARAVVISRTLSERSKEV